MKILGDKSLFSKKKKILNIPNSVLKYGKTGNWDKTVICGGIFLTRKKLAWGPIGAASEENKKTVLSKSNFPVNKTPENSEILGKFFWIKIANFINNLIKFLAKNWFFFEQILKWWSKIEILVKNRNFDQKLKF